MEVSGGHETLSERLVSSDSTEKGPGDKSPTYKVLWAAAMLASGTFTTIFAKAMFESSAEGNVSCNMHDDDDFNCKFNKPWFSVLLMKLSMSLCLVLYYGFGWGKENPEADNPSWKTIKAVALPAALDLLNTILGNLGLVFVNSSIYQMTRGSVVIFSAILSVRWLGRTLRSFHYWSILFVLIAVILVGVAGIEESPDDGNGNMVIFGLVCILAAQAVTAVQFICEESLMNNPATTLDPVALVGFEGLWGLLYYAFLCPILTFTPRSDISVSTIWHEDFGDTFVMLGNSNGLVWLCFGYFCTILIYNISANIVTQCLSAVVRSILEACRVMGVWCVGLFFFYSGLAVSIGEKWSNWSYLELFGFMVLMYGTFTYKGLTKIPCVPDEVYELALQDEKNLARQLRDDATKTQVNYNAIMQGEEEGV
jgi:drug/metabolite transporter (DMT)-like permease